MSIVRISTATSAPPLERPIEIVSPEAQSLWRGFSPRISAQYMTQVALTTLPLWLADELALLLSVALVCGIEMLVGTVSAVDRPTLWMLSVGRLVCNQLQPRALSGDWRQSDNRTAPLDDGRNGRLRSVSGSHDDALRRRDAAALVLAGVVDHAPRGAAHSSPAGASHGGQMRLVGTARHCLGRRRGRSGSVPRLCSRRRSKVCGRSACSTNRTTIGPTIMSIRPGIFGPLEAAETIATELGVFWGVVFDVASCGVGCRHRDRPLRLQHSASADSARPGHSCAVLAREPTTAEIWRVCGSMSACSCRCRKSSNAPWTLC